MRLLLLGLLIHGALLASSETDQIAAAVLAAPKDMRSGAAVLGYNDKGELVTLRKGENDLICLASDPKAKAYSVACYHKDLEPYMARGRELIAQGMKGKGAARQALERSGRGQGRHSQRPTHALRFEW
jgi:hypothetical protein